MPTPTLGKVPTLVLVTTTALASLVRVALLGLAATLVATLERLVIPARAVLPPQGRPVTLARLDTTRGLTQAVAILALLLVTPALVVTQVAAVLIRALVMDNLTAPQTSMSTSLALFPYAPCLLATSIRAHLRQLKLMRAPCLVLPLPC